MRNGPMQHLALTGTQPCQGAAAPESNPRPGAGGGAIRFWRSLGVCITYARPSAARLFLTFPRAWHPAGWTGWLDWLAGLVGECVKVRRSRCHEY